MKRTHLSAWLGLLCLLGSAPSGKAGSFTADFNDGLVPAGANVYGNSGDNASGVIEATGGFENTGCLKLTKAVGSKQGSLIIDDLDASQSINSFTANFKIRIGGGTATPADGCSFCFANDLPDGTFGEEGAGNGLRVGFDIYNNSGEAPSFRIFWGGVQVATSGVVPIGDLVTGNNFVDVQVTIAPTGAFSLTYNGRAIMTNRNIGFEPVAGGRFGFGGRTGGANANQFIDNVSISTSPGDTLLPGIINGPLSQVVVSGYPALMNVVAFDPLNSTYQWESKAPGGTQFLPVSGATDALYTPGPLTPAATGTEYRVVVSNLAGASVTSDPASVAVVDLPHGTPNTVAFDFNDGTVPPQTAAYGTAFVPASGGVGDSGFISLTEALANQAGTWTVDDLNAGGPVGSIDVAFKLLLTPEPDAVPADGFGFHWAPDLPEAGFPAAEEPVGTGLSVGFDVYNNGNNEAPAVDVFWLGTRLGGTAVPAALLNTQDQFVDVLIRLSPAGLVDVAFNGIVLVYQLQIPNWTAFSGAKYGFAARTGGAFQRQYLDDVQIKSTAYVGPIGIVSSPQNVTTLVNRTASFTVTSSAPSQSTYQWEVSAGGGPFTPIASSNVATYTTPTLTVGDDQKQFRCRVTSTANASVAVSNPATLTVINLGGPTSPQILDTFDNQTGVDNQGSVPGAVQTLSGTLVGTGLEFPAGLSGGGYLLMTEQVNSQFGALVVSDFNAAAPVGGFTASVKAQLYSPDPADGWSFSWGRGIAATQVYGGLEAGVGDDLRVSFYTYAGNGRSIRVNWRGTQLANVAVPLALLQTPIDEFEDVIIKVTPATATSDALLDVAQDGTIVISSLALPGLTGVSGASFALAARTGGLNELHAYDDLAISTSLYVGPISVTAQPPATQVVLAGKTVTLTAETSNPPATTYQWQRAEPGSSVFTNVGAPGSVYTTPALTGADSGARFQCVCTGPTNVVTTTPAEIIVAERNLPATWDRIIDFNDGATPEGAALLGTAAVLFDGGLDNSGMLELTENAGGLQGSMVLADIDGGNPVDGFVTQFFLRTGSTAAGNASGTPADGSSFVWAPVLITDAFGEAGTGLGLIVSFDVYDNGGGEAPAIEAIWDGSSLGNIRVPGDLLKSGLDFREVVIRVNPGGTLDVIFGDEVIFWHQPLPGYAPFTGGSFGWGARTGGETAQQDVDNIRLTSFGEGDAPALNYTEVGANLIITFDGVLESSPDLVNWTPLVGQASPLILPKASLTGRMYLRARK